jgi:signal transduction histidine kinase
LGTVTILWTVIATVAMTLALFCALAWALDRRHVGYLMFCLIAVATAACTPFELGMMHAQTPAAYGAWLRGYHLPIFFVFLGQTLFVYFYLGTARAWLLLAFLAWRLAILAVNFLVDPNIHFQSIDALRQIDYLGEQISVVSAGKPRNLQWMAIGSMLLLHVYVADAAIRRWRKGGRESRRKAAVVALGIGLPMACNVTLNMLAVYGLIHRPIYATIWFVGILAAVAYELGREIILNSRARLQVAQLRGELAQLGRVDTLGQLASGIAHELAQPLTASLGNIEAARIHLRKANPDLDELRAIVNDVHADTQRAGEVLDRMRALIRRRPLDRHPVAIDEVFRDVTSLLHSEAIARNIELNARVDERAPRAIGDRVQITQVMINLTVNAMDALQGLATGPRQVTLEARSAPSGGLEISVVDSGPGIPRQRLEEIFKPLFTTKPGSMGLGLALSRTIVEAHAGRLWAENREGNSGAVLRMTLPAA